ncbi:hypothetical protein DL96DRAFT_1704024 [Flagelloscypha sp. PMI_526]|nr:hypothetical protein DL96DRAFT_1704024 [Flagelloscypha sp. PMI_526]
MLILSSDLLGNGPSSLLTMVILVSIILNSLTIPSSYRDGFFYADGIYPSSGSTVTSVHQGGSWSSTGTLCGESMIFRMSGNELIPTWKYPDNSLLTLVVIYHETNNILAAAPSLTAYNYGIASGSNAYEVRLKFL